MNKKLLCMAILTLPTIACAGNIQKEDAIIVSDSRFDEPIMSSLSPVIIVSSEQIDKMQVSNITDIIKLLPGAEVSVNGGRGQSSSVKIRGGNATDTLILVNGVRINSAYNGTIDLSTVPVNQIEKIEYIRGSRASVYGSQASAAIINIITRPDFQDNAIKLKAQYGSYKNRQISGVVKYAPTENQELKISLATEKEKGYNVHPLEGLNDGDHHGFQGSNVMIDYQYDFDNPYQVYANFSWNKTQAEFDGSYYFHEYDGNFFENFSYEVGAKYITDFYKSNLSLNYQKTDDYQQIVKNPIKENKNENTPIHMRTVNVTWANELAISDFITLGGGFDYNSNKLGSNSKSYYELIVPEYDLIKDWAGFISATLEFQNIVFEGSGRYDHNTQYGGHYTYQLGGKYKFLDDYAIALRHGTSFRSPSFMELYYPWMGDSRLNPEKSKNYELILSGSHEIFKWTFTGYVNNYDDRIIYDNATWSFKNIQKARVKGLEFETEFDLLSLHNKVSFDIKSPKNRNTGFDIPYVARRTFKWVTWGQINDFDLSLSFVASSKRYQNEYSKDLGGYSVWNAAIAYNVNDYFKINGKIDNIFSKKYEYAQGYKTPETTLAIGFELNY